MNPKDYIVESRKQIREEELSCNASKEDMNDAIKSGSLLRMRGTRQCALREFLMMCWSFFDEDVLREWLTEMALHDYNYNQILDVLKDRGWWFACAYLDTLHDLCRATIRAEETEYQNQLAAS